MMQADDAKQVDLAALTVRPVRDAAEQATWDRLMAQHHYLGFRGMVGGGLRHVAETPDGTWVAMLGWCAGAFKVAARDHWIGWAREVQFRRLHLIANNCRFLVLPQGCMNLASKVLMLSMRRLSADMQTKFGHPVLLAETFVDPSRFKGSCYRAANWTALGETRGYARSAGGWVAHGQPKQVLVYPLHPEARAALSGLAQPAHWRCQAREPALPSATRLRSLFEYLREVPEYRRARGVRHTLASVLAIAVAAKLAGAQGPTAMAEFAARLSQRQLAAVRAFRSPTTGRLTPPSRASLHRILSALDPDALEGAIRRFTADCQPATGAMALDGKAAPVHRRNGSDDSRMFLAAIRHGDGVVLGQTQSDSAGGEITSARRLIEEVGSAGYTFTFDALHSCSKTARLIVQQGGEYVMPVKANHPTVLDDIKAFNWQQATTFTTTDVAHGRIETRTCALLDLPASADEFANLPGRRQAFRITRERTVKRTGKQTTETTYGLTSLTPARAGPAEILALNRGHWEIENRLHYVRDVTFDEDRSRVRTGQLPRNLACLSNVAISIVRLRARFQHQPEAHRHYAAKQGEALREVLTPV